MMNLVHPLSTGSASRCIHRLAVMLSKHLCGSLQLRLSVYLVMGLLLLLVHF